MPKKTIIALIVLATLAGLFKLAVWTMFTDHVDSKKYSLSYFLRMHSEVIKNAPIIMPVDTPTYGSDILDGNAPEMYSVHYNSKQTKEKLIAELTEYLKKRKYQPSEYWQKWEECDYAFDNYPGSGLVTIDFYEGEDGTLSVSMCEFP